MKFDFPGERVLAVVAHPDDAELLCAGTLARAQADGAAVGICVLTRGDKGQPAEPIPDLTTVRRREMAAAADLLGAKLFPCELADGTLADDSPKRRRLLRIYRGFAPTLVLAHDPADYHPRHRAAAALAEAATWFAASRGHVTRQKALPTQPALWWMDTVAMTGFEPGFFIDISAHTEVKHRMLRCHHSQLRRGPDG